MTRVCLFFFLFLRKKIFVFLKIFFSSLCQQEKKKKKKEKDKNKPYNNMTTNGAGAPTSASSGPVPSRQRKVLAQSFGMMENLIKGMAMVKAEMDKLEAAVGATYEKKKLTLPDYDEFCNFEGVVVAAPAIYKTEPGSVTQLIREMIPSCARVVFFDEWSGDKLYYRPRAPAEIKPHAALKATGALLLLSGPMALVSSVFDMHSPSDWRGMTSYGRLRVARFVIREAFGEREADPLRRNICQHQGCSYTYVDFHEGKAGDAVFFLDMPDVPEVQICAECHKRFVLSSTALKGWDRYVAEECQAHVETLLGPEDSDDSDDEDDDSGSDVCSLSDSDSDSDSDDEDADDDKAPAEPERKRAKLMHLENAK